MAEPPSPVTERVDAASEPPVTVDELRKVDLFEELDDAQLAEWVPVAHAYHVAAGGIIVEQGEENRGMNLLLVGEAQATIIDQGGSEPVGRHKAPTWIGAIAALTGGRMGVRMHAETDCRLALVENTDFRRLAFAQPAIHRRVMQAVAPVMSRVTSVEQSRERLTSLGTMAAGLAHELNNPAAAARRAAQQMTEALAVLSSTIASFVDSGMERDQAEGLVALQQRAVARSASCSALDALDAADAEEDLIARLEALQIDEPWQLAEPLAVAGVDQAWLDEVAVLAGPATDAAVRWVAATVAAGRLAAELEESTERMSSLVGAVKSYAYMDRGDTVEVDLHEGLETTLKVLGYKLKHTEIQLVRNYDRELPKLTVRGSELNQVWTNLLDNAIDALGQTGTITITTYPDGECAVVEISDDGPGVPEDVAPRIFDPFFTTKEVGEGTGLGLSISHHIIAGHGGRIEVESAPGAGACFRVYLPLE